jgi:hypothetical protein
MVELLILKLLCLLIVLLWYGVMVGVLFLVFILSALDTNDNGNREEGDFGIHQEEDQGHIADQGKPSKLVASLIPILLMHDLLLFTKMHGLIYCYLSLDSNCWRLGSTSQLLSPMWMTPFLTPTYPLGSGLMISTMTFLENLVVEQKTLGWEHSNKILKMSSKTLE